MDKKIDVKKTAFNKNQYSKTIDTKFKELGIIPISQELESTISIEDFFNYYNDIFYDIPATGEQNSHEFLIKTSSEYINFDPNNEIIEALRDEIARLRQDNLRKDIKILELESGQKFDIDPNLFIEEAI
jgi:hypothetical protein